MKTQLVWSYGEGSEGIQPTPTASATVELCPVAAGLELTRGLR